MTVHEAFLEQDLIDLQNKNELLEKELELYKKALFTFVNWAEECDIGYDSLSNSDQYSEEIEQKI